MKKADLAKRLAKRSGLTRAEAADELDRVINRILHHLRQGKSASLPGLGTFTPGRTWRFEFDGSETDRAKNR